MTGTKLIVGLGNPGKEYEGTRHNVGKYIVQHFAETLGVQFTSDKNCESYIAKGVVQDQPIVLAYPKTYMNVSGRAVARLLKRTCGVQDMIIVLDDIETGWGHVKKAFEGGTRGHNGVKSIHSLVGSKAFTQLRVGVGRPETGDVSDYVLGRFTVHEREELPSVVDRAEALLVQWIGEAS